MTMSSVERMQPTLSWPAQGGSAGEDLPPGQDCCPVYPVELADRPMTVELLALYRRWMIQEEWDPAAEGEPWVPVGACGPVLVLGHFRPMEVSPPLPAWCFQPVRLGVEDYQSRLEETRDRCCGEDSGRACVRDAGHVRGVRFPKRFIRPRGLRAALQFLLEYFPHGSGEEGRLRERLGNGTGEDGRLPEGYEAAVDFVLARGPVADLSGLSLPEPGKAGCPAPLSDGLSLVASQGRCLWVAVLRGDPGLAGDRLLDGLGDGWRVRMLRTAVRVPAAGAGPAQPGGRARIVIENRIQAAPRRGGEGFTPGEIVIGEAQVGELESYDPRRPDRDPAKVFLRELSAAVACGASDLHIEPGVEGARIRARVDGVMEEWLEMGAAFGQAVVGAAKELTGLPSERFLPQDGSCTIRHAGAVVGARVSSYPIRKRGQKLVLRLLPRRGRVPALGELLPPWQSRLMMRAASSPQGLILVCGPTGSGKTTTLFSVLAALNAPTRNIMTMEDPIEYELEGLNQAELDPHRGVSWDMLLKGFLRQDPDAGLIGEVRDRETAETAVRQALTGHVVFATLHTLSCARTLERLVDMGVNPDMLASALTLVESQRLVRRLCPRCRVERQAGPVEQELFRRHSMTCPERHWVASPQGCPQCRRGYKGRVAAVEVLPVVDEVVRLIEERARSRAFEEWMAAEGLPNVFQAALQLVAEGASSLEGCGATLTGENHHEKP